MTYRERREARAERLRGWADKRATRAGAELERSHELIDAIPFGQPILVGHHSEQADRRRRDRAWDALGRSAENAKTAERQSSSAAEIERQLDRSIYSDDPDAIERLRERIAELEAQRETIKQRNADYRREHRAELRELTPYQRDQAMPHRGYELENLSGNLSRQRKRLAQLEREREHGTPDRVITARYAGTCADCGAELERGQTIRYSKQAGARCESCGPAGEAPAKPARPWHQCPTCQTPHALSRREAARGYQCHRCADREEGLCG